MGDSSTSLPAADKISSSLHLDTLSGTLQGSLDHLSSTGQSVLDRIIPPPTRSRLKTTLSRFATARPLLASFLLSQAAVSGLPLALFLIVTVTVVVFALLAGILVGVLGAVLFIVLALGVALFVLLPTLFVTTFFAVAVWLWALAAYHVVKWFSGADALPPGGGGGGGSGGFLDKIESVVGGGGGGGEPQHKENGVDGRETTRDRTEKASRSREENSVTTDRKGTTGGEAEYDATENATTITNDRTTSTTPKSPGHRRKARDGDRQSNKTSVKGVPDASESLTDVGKGFTGIVS